MQLRVQADKSTFSAEEWQVRVDLAAAHRAAVMEGLHEGIFNHLTARVPGKPRYYQIPFGMHWSEVHASCFMEVDYDGNQIEEEWSGIDVALKRRFNLIPNLVSTVQSYAKHEIGTMEAVTGQRSDTGGPGNLNDRVPLTR